MSQKHKKLMILLEKKRVHTILLTMRSWIAKAMLLMIMVISPSLQKVDIHTPTISPLQLQYQPQYSQQHLTCTQSFRPSSLPTRIIIPTYSKSTTFSAQ
jgi:hypothetical protein